MFALKRKRDEDVVIVTPEGRKIVVCVVELRGGSVRLGFTAEKTVKIYRGEIYQRLQLGVK